MSDELDSTALSDLPIFPLPDVVLFPGAVLPLHVFEPRYRAMLRDALAGSQLIAMTRLRPSSGDPPEVYRIAGVGRIIACRETEDGRYFLLLRGLGRVRITEELPETNGYRRVAAELLDDGSTSRPLELLATNDQLLALCDRLSDALSEETDGAKLRELVREADAPGERADLVAAALIADPDLRQLLLETLDPADRMDQLVELLARATAEMGREPDFLN